MLDKQESAHINSQVCPPPLKELNDQIKNLFLKRHIQLEQKNKNLS